MLHRYSVWAPDAERVDLHVGATGDRVEPMAPDGNGWWAVDAEPGDGRYAFSLDDGDPRPDPRGRRLPDGVHAASALVDPARFTWTDGDWVAAGSRVRRSTNCTSARSARPAPSTAPSNTSIISSSWASTWSS